jgi:hypothetical protein
VYRGTGEVQVYIWYRSSTMVQGYRSCAGVIQWYRISTIILGEHRVTRWYRGTCVQE